MSASQRVSVAFTKQKIPMPGHAAERWSPISPLFLRRPGEERLRARTDADLEALDVVVVDGWVMARSEAELCAAVDLDRGLA